MTESVRFSTEFRASSTTSGSRTVAGRRPDDEAEPTGPAATVYVPAVPHLRRLARNAALLGLLVIALPVFANATREGMGVLVTLVAPIPVAVSTALLCTPLLRRGALPRRPLRRLPAGWTVSTEARPRWGVLLQVSLVVAVAGLLGVGALLEGPGAAFGLLVNAHALGGLLVGSAVAVLRTAAQLHAWEVRNRVQLVTDAGLRGGAWVRPRQG